MRKSRFGSRRRHGLLARESIAVNHTRVERRCHDAGLTVRRRSRERVGAADPPATRATGHQPEPD